MKVAIAISNTKNIPINTRTINKFTIEIQKKLIEKKRKKRENQRKFGTYFYLQSLSQCIIYLNKTSLDFRGRSWKVLLLGMAAACSYDRYSHSR